jgi:mannose-6-phosphate isomerase-like protein (cupin superfamily)
MRRTDARSPFGSRQPGDPGEKRAGCEWRLLWARKVSAMKLIEHESQEMVDWRPGVATRMLVSAVTGSVQLCIFEQFCEPDLGAPSHLHAVEEVLEVVEGDAEIWVGDETVMASGGHSVIVPAGVRHGFRNAAKTGILHMRATLASPIFEASYDDSGEQSRRYVPSS